MNTLEIVQIGHPVLRQTARALTREEILSDDIQQLITHMRDTMRTAPGVGLAAPQIGRDIQLAVIEDREEYHRNWPAIELQKRQRKPVAFHVIINPKLRVDKSQEVTFHEGCLSIPGLIGLVPRYLSVDVDYLNEHAEPQHIHATGWYARILQHEINHLQGILCIDHMPTRSISTIENYIKYQHD